MKRLGSSFATAIGFRPLPVTILTVIVYVGLAIPLLIVHLVVPKAPRSPTPVPGVNLTQAWLDLKYLSNGFHPYNSHRNDIVRDWLLARLDEIVRSNNASAAVIDTWAESDESGQPSDVVIFNDMTSNLTFSASRLGAPTVSTYFEGTNIMVYIRGSKDPQGSWWARDEAPSSGGVMVNAHYDSVSTGFGSTDDGVGVITLLQLAGHLSAPGTELKRGVVLLFNNGEEDFLNGARAFARHPVSSFPRTFLNLEGAGAGGRATLFRSTDTEVTRYYGGTEHPFGTVASADGFDLGLIRSQTDYVVFNGILGFRGLDVAFMEPRARYHTDQDDVRHTSIDSMWHMMSAAIHTVVNLASVEEPTFEGDPPEKGEAPTGQGSPSVWFDLFGKAFAIYELHTLFAWSVMLMVVAPLLLIILGVALSKKDRFYAFSTSERAHSSSTEIPLHGLRGVFRFPIIFVAATASVVGLAYLLAKSNPFIIYSSPFAVWSMMFSAWVFVFWFLSRAIDYLRPTAFHRMYSLLWMFLLTWVFLVIGTVFEERFKIASSYIIAIDFAFISVATLIAFSEQLALPKKADYAEKQAAPDDLDFDADSTGESPEAQRQPEPNEGETSEGNEESADHADESTSLLSSQRPKTFAHYASTHQDADQVEQGVPSQKRRKSSSSMVFDDEQFWSQSIPSWTWILQFLLIGPFPIIILAQLGLLVVSATYQTLADGSPALSIYSFVAFFTVMILLPLAPFLHRQTYHVPTFLLAIFVGTLIYNLVAFPFSGNNRLKLSFIQRVDLESGMNKVSLVGSGDSFLEEIISTLPSAAGKDVTKRPSKREYSWPGLPPKVVPNTPSGVPPDLGYADWLHYNATRTANANEARIILYGRNTRSCKLVFENPIADFEVRGSDSDDRFPRVPDQGVAEIRLWSREWESPWEVTIRWKGAAGVDGRVVCLWNDRDGRGAIPALDEIRRFAPEWVAITKLSDGLVEGSKALTI